MLQVSGFLRFDRSFPVFTLRVTQLCPPLPPPFQVQYSDAQSGKDFVTYLTLSPVQMTFHGTGSTLQASHDQVCVCVCTDRHVKGRWVSHLFKAVLPKMGQRCLILIKVGISLA